MLISKAGIGHILAPWQFLIFVILMIVGSVVAGPAVGAGRGEMIAFDTAAITFLISCAPVFRHGPQEMRESAQKNDANRGVLLLIAAAVSGVIMTAVASELSQKGRPQPSDVLLIIVTLCLCWLFSTVVYALHYAHLFYTQSSQGNDGGGLCFPGTENPDYWDFVYFSSCLAMTFQTSDVEITSKVHRRATIFHTLGAFVFNIVVIAFSINILGSK